MTISIAPEKDHWKVMVGAESHSVCLHKSTALGVARSLCEQHNGSPVVIHETDGTVHVDSGESIDDGGPDIGRILGLLQQLKARPVFEVRHGEDDDPEAPAYGMTMKAFELSREDFPDLYGDKVTPMRRTRRKGAR